MLRNSRARFRVEAFVWRELFAAFFAGAVFVTPSLSVAAEGASSNYFPGAYGSLLPGVAPEAGGVLADLSLFYSAKASRAVLQGAANLSVEVDAYYNLIQGLHVWDAPAIGGRFAVGGYIPLGYASLGASIGPLSVSGDEFGLGDIGIIPASFYWSSGNFHINLYELIVAPTGDYDVSRAVNIGRNYWSFDTVAAATWFNPQSGTEVFATGATDQAWDIRSLHSCRAINL
jgi:hypothetical protein